MKKVIADLKQITLDDLVNRLQDGEKLTIVYKAKSDDPYYAFFSKTSHGHYGFRCHTGVSNKMTFLMPTMRESLKAAIGNGKDLLVFERNEQEQLFKF